MGGLVEFAQKHADILANEPWHVYEDPDDANWLFKFHASLENGCCFLITDAVHVYAEALEMRHMLRRHVKLHGANTTTTDDNTFEHHLEDPAWRAARVRDLVRLHAPSTIADEDVDWVTERHTLNADLEILMTGSTYSWKWEAMSLGSRMGPEVLARQLFLPLVTLADSAFTAPAALRQLDDAAWTNHVDKAAKTARTANVTRTFFRKPRVTSSLARISQTLNRAKNLSPILSAYDDPPPPLTGPPSPGINAYHSQARLEANAIDSDNADGGGARRASATGRSGSGQRRRSGSSPKRPRSASPIRVDEDSEAYEPAPGQQPPSGTAASRKHHVIGNEDDESGAILSENEEEESVEGKAAVQITSLEPHSPTVAGAATAAAASNSQTISSGSSNQNGDNVDGDEDEGTPTESEDEGDNVPYHPAVGKPTVPSVPAAKGKGKEAINKNQDDESDIPDSASSGDNNDDGKGQGLPSKHKKSSPSRKQPSSSPPPRSKPLPAKPVAFPKRKAAVDSDSNDDSDAETVKKPKTSKPAAGAAGSGWQGPRRANIQKKKF
ncbi:hypothetical protein DL93DRAFT_2097586 [Clavulina sp. PMI_390]|nr:hypothetical protein DL93DRAFT_2097586 [Clavulina sp. PMI_390]